ncbi:MAG: phosphonopyruvate decarboxylase [Sphingomonadales bacterium]|jgi:phosphonopyruvate decarboxylase|nr:phosphonopyruvate decarboxylase [Sphingomonadales bacterium]
MIDSVGFLQLLQRLGVKFFAGVPDSTLAAFCRSLAEALPPDRHVVAANEGAAVALAAGHYLATGAMGCVYMQNSGLGNAANPLISLTAPEVYGIPALLLIGWRGEIFDGVQSRDEPQHTLQGRITLDLLDCLQIDHEVLGAEEADPEPMVAALIERGRAQARPVALVVRRGVLDSATGGPPAPAGGAPTREDALRAALAALPEDAVFVATTGKVSRELYEHRLAGGVSPWRDFLSVGSMGHALQIAAGIALARPEKQVVCIDGDGALIMHMGGMTTSATIPNLLHLVMNNGAHESAGGLASRGFAIDMPALARACGYDSAARAERLDGIGPAIGRALATPGSAFIEIRTAMGSRPDLSRPKGALAEAKRGFMRQLAGDAAA